VHRHESIVRGLWGPFASRVRAHARPHRAPGGAQIANMWMIPMGMALGAPVSVADLLLRNLLPVTLGNLFGGVVCVATAYSMCYGRLRGD